MATPATGAREKPRIGFYIHLLAYVLVNALLIGINLSTSTSYLWFIWPLLGWGVGLLAHALVVFVFAKGRRIPNRMQG